MQINWFTFFIQIINFLILVVLLRRFLYGPIVKVMDEREALITSRLGAAEQKEQEANREIEAYQQKLGEVDAQRAVMLAQIKEEVKVLRETLIQQSRAEIDQIRAGWYKIIQQEKDRFLQDFRRQIVQMICTVARRTLTDLANVELEQQAINIFIERLRLLDEIEREAFTASLRQPESEIKICSAFEICPQMRQRIIEVVQEQIGDRVAIQFEISAELAGGIELSTSGCKIAWSIADYLEEFEGKLTEALETEAKNDVSVC